MPDEIKRLGDPRVPNKGRWMLMPTPEGTCSQCAVVHEPEEAHDAQSLAYQYAFYADHNRWPTWRDAIAHCAPEDQAIWEQALAEHGVTLDGPVARSDA
jgi:hypothetical protein